MRNLEVALCDTEESYILKFASYLMTNMKVGIHIFTTPESFYTDSGSYDVALMSEDFKEVSEYKNQGEVKHKYFFSENQNVENENSIYKYQSIDSILEQIVEFKRNNNIGAGIGKSFGNSKLVGVYSPSAHDLQLPFAMALANTYRNGGKVLFLDLEEISILPSLVGKSCERDLLDLLYEINASSANIDLSSYTRNFLGVDFIQPFSNPNDICEIESETWSQFFEMLLKTDYETIVILFGRTINGFSSIIERLEKLYVLGKPGDYFRRGQDMFFDYLERINSSVDSLNVILPMSAANLADGSYQIEELLQGNLGVFVKKLMNMSGKNTIENYG